MVGHKWCELLNGVWWWDVMPPHKCAEQDHEDHEDRD